jgi:hypothetical protein
MSLFNNVDGINKLTGKDASVYAFNVNTNEQLLLAHSGSIEITYCERGKEPSFYHELEDARINELGEELRFYYKLGQGRINLDVFSVMQRQYDSDSYLPRKTHQFFINFVLVDKSGEPQKMQLTGCRPTCSKIPVFLQFAVETIYTEWTGTAKEIIEVE